MRNRMPAMILTIWAIALTAGHSILEAGNGEPSPAGPVTPIEALLPANTLAIVVIKDARAFRQQFQTSALGTVLRGQPEQTSTLRRRWAAATAALDARLGVPTAELAASANGPLAVALIPLEDPSRSRPTWIVMIDVGADTTAAQRLITRMAAARAARPEATSRPVTIARTPAILYGPKGAEAGAALVGRHLLISGAAAGLEAALTALQKGPQKGLLTVGAIRDLRSHLPTGEADAYGYLDPQGLRLWLGRSPLGTPKTINENALPEILGGVAMESARGVGFAVNFDGATVRDVVAVAVDGQRTLLSKWPSGGRARDLLTMVPARADLGLAVRCDAARVWDQLDIDLRFSLPPETYGSVHEMLGRLTRTTGFDLRGDLLAAIGHDWVLIGLKPDRAVPGPASSRSKPLAPAQYALIVSIRDRARLLHCLTAFRQFIESESTASTAGGGSDAAPGPAVSLKQFKLGEQVVDYLHVRARPTLSPSIAITARHLVVTSTTSAMRRILAGLGRSEDSIAADKTFAAFVEHVDGEAPAMAVLSMERLIRALAGGTREVAPPGPAFTCSARPAGPGLLIRSHGRASPTISAAVALLLRALAPDGPPTAASRPASTLPAGPASPPHHPAE